MTADPSFRMMVEDVFSIRNRGTVVTGKIETGTLKVSDEIVIRGRNREKTTTITGIESSRKVLDQAKPGDMVGILLKDITREDIPHGDIILSPGSEFSIKP